MWREYNPNPAAKRVGDCTVRALTKVTGKDWDTVFTGLVLHGYSLCDMPSSNHVWGAYLRAIGFVRRVISDECPDCYTVADFCRDHPTGTYILAVSGHVVAVDQGDWYDAWDSRDEIPIYYWERSN